MPDISSSFSSATKLSRPKMERRPRHSCLYSHWWRKSQSRWDKPITHQKRNYFCLNIHLFFSHHQPSFEKNWFDVVMVMVNTYENIWLKYCRYFLTKQNERKKIVFFLFGFVSLGKTRGCTADCRRRTRSPDVSGMPRELYGECVSCLVLSTVFGSRQQPRSVGDKSVNSIVNP